MTSPQDVTALLAEWRGGNEIVRDQLFPIVYEELRKLARARLRRERAGHTLQPTALVNEAYLRLVDQTRVEWQSRAHFFGIASTMMRRILVDHARARNAARRGCGEANVSVEDLDGLAMPAMDDGELIDLHEALEALGELDPLASRVIELRYFGGSQSRRRPRS
jgi:RNA polymerase sigma factor (TIGR02999 family)